MQESILSQPGEGLEVDFDNVDHALAIHLLQIHWNNIDIPSLVTYLPTFIGGLISGENVYMNKILLNAVFFSSSLYSDRTIRRSDSASRHSVGAFFNRIFQGLLSRPDVQPSIASVMGIVICAGSLLSRGYGYHAVELRKKAWHMLATLEIQKFNSEGVESSNPLALAYEVEKEVCIRVRLGIFALDTLLMLYLGEPIACHLPTLPMGKMRDDFEEEQDWTLYVDPTGNSGFTKLCPQRARTITTYEAQIATYEVFAKIIHTFFLDKSVKTDEEIQDMWRTKRQFEGELYSMRLKYKSCQEPLFSLDRPSAPHIVALVVWNYAAEILLQIPFLEQARFENVGRGKYVGTQRLCRSKAFEICGLMSEYKKWYSLRWVSLMTSFSIYLAYMASSESLFGVPDPILLCKLERMVDQLERGSNPGLRAMMMKPGWQPPHSETAVKDYLHDASIKVYRDWSLGKPNDIWAPYVPRDDHNIGHRDKYLNFGTESEMTTVAYFVNTWCPDDMPGSPAWLRDAMRLIMTKPLICQALKLVSGLQSAGATEGSSIVTKGRVLYTNLVVSIQKRLRAEPAETSIELLIAVSLLAMLERHQSSLVTSWGLTKEHWATSLELLECRTGIFHRDGIAHELFLDMRYHSAIHFLTAQRSSFPSSFGWKNDPWKDPKQEDSLQQLIDIAFEVAGAQREDDDDEDDGPRLRAGPLQPYHDELLRWKLRFAPDFPFSIEYRAPPTFIPNLIFRDWNIEGTAIVERDPILYPNPSLALPWLSASQHNLAKAFRHEV
ncbi:uncharacterized protein N7496_007041 [Penicillium cataractarum]|uniref:Transcription factor domain-containing protein n=1 Tax=Penicillium cataractarum TaxID=2100454 RepID=A0A9W9S4M2_9EURO|nr:uncharacterized protein N7496_007041 [Penicillium cataractarum]KAJ5370949.1 hypothetical protein N7496_007041 [Penicillium cataractarum]